VDLEALRKNKKAQGLFNVIDQGVKILRKLEKFTQLSEKDAIQLSKILSDFWTKIQLLFNSSNTLTTLFDNSESERISITERIKGKDHERELAMNRDVDEANRLWKEAIGLELELEKNIARQLGMASEGKAEESNLKRQLEDTGKQLTNQTETIQNRRNNQAAMCESDIEALKTLFDTKQATHLKRMDQFDETKQKEQAMIEKLEEAKFNKEKKIRRLQAQVAKINTQLPLAEERKSKAIAEKINEENEHANFETAVNQRKDDLMAAKSHCRTLSQACKHVNDFIGVTCGGITEKFREVQRLLETRKMEILQAHATQIRTIIRRAGELLLIKQTRLRQLEEEKNHFKQLKENCKNMLDRASSTHAQQEETKVQEIAEVQQEIADLEGKLDSLKDSYQNTRTAFGSSGASSRLSDPFQEWEEKQAEHRRVLERKRQAERCVSQLSSIDDGQLLLQISMLINQRVALPALQNCSSPDS